MQYSDFILPHLQIPLAIFLSANLCTHPYRWYFFFLLPLTRLSVFPYCHTLSAQQSYFHFAPVYRVHLSCFCNNRSVVLYCRTPSMLIRDFCEVLFYTVKGRRCVYLVETVYIIRFQSYPNRHYEQIMQIFHPRNPVFMYLSSPRQVYSTEKLRSRNRHFFRFFMTQQTAAK